jgi:S-adenosylmethionine synthetase
VTFRARFLARQVVARGWARRTLVRLAYAIGVAKPVSVLVVTEAGQGGVARAEDDAELADRLRGEFDLTPAWIIRLLDLQRPISFPTAAYGHFGRDDLALPWERVST